MNAENRQLIQLLRSIARLALPADDQLAYLAGIGVGDLADELALDLDDATALGERLGFTPAELELVARLEQLLDDLTETRTEQTWRAEGLRTDPRWEQTRLVAREFLFRQGQ
ncbi:hypothetical protein AB0E69_17595 [Kribbella sp. NPDC026611]|uniref:hypothetical protein n=1 Tax=Kribbella sp. NPDC026611 TaxID=3154911 RepID=UPI0033E8E010